MQNTARVEPCKQSAQAAAASAGEMPVRRQTTIVTVTYGDRLGYLALSKPGLAERDRQVFDACRRHGLPLAVCMAGGYAPAVEDIVDIHEATVRQAAAHWRRAAGSPDV